MRQEGRRVSPFSAFSAAPNQPPSGTKRALPGPPCRALPGLARPCPPTRPPTHPPTPPTQPTRDVDVVGAAAHRSVHHGGADQGKGPRRAQHHLGLRRDAVQAGLRGTQRGSGAGVWTLSAPRGCLLGSIRWGQLLLETCPHTQALSPASQASPASPTHLVLDVADEDGHILQLTPILLAQLQAQLLQPLLAARSMAEQGQQGQASVGPGPGPAHERVVAA